jgi:hypothetical protein
MEQLTLAAKIWKVMDTFKRKEAEWLPYWRNGEYVTVQPEGAYVSLYRHPKNGLLAVVSNLSHREAKVTVGLNLKRLGLKGKVVARDALTGEEVQVEKGQFTITLGSFGWKILWVR